MSKPLVSFPATQLHRLSYCRAPIHNVVNLLVLAIGLGAPQSAFAGILSGKIVDTTGAAIGGAYVLAYDNQLQVTNIDTLPGKSVISQSDGSFVLNLTPGFYDVCILSTGFTASCRKVLMSANNTTRSDSLLVLLS